MSRRYGVKPAEFTASIIRTDGTIDPFRTTMIEVIVKGRVEWRLNPAPHLKKGEAFAIAPPEAISEWGGRGTTQPQDHPI